MRWSVAVVLVSACSAGESGGASPPDVVPLPDRREDAGAEGGRVCPAEVTACGDVCVDLATNGDHCGACGHSCLGAACAAGTCAPSTLATGLARPTAVRVQGANAYVLRDNGIDRIALAGGAATPLFTSTMETFDVTSGPYALGVDANYAYFFMTEGSTRYVHRCALGGCFSAPTQLAAVSVLSPFALDVDATTIAWSGTYQDVRQCAAQSCASSSTLVPSQEGKVQIVLRPDAVVWTNEFNRAVYRCPRMGCTQGTELAGPNAMTGAPGPLAVAGDDLYFATSSGPAPKYAIYKCRVAGCGGAPTLVAQGDGEPGTMTADPSAVHWTLKGDAVAATGAVLSCGAQKTCGSTPVVLASGRASPLGIAMSAGAIYWVENRAPGALAWVAKP